MCLVHVPIGSRLLWGYIVCQELNVVINYDLYVLTKRTKQTTVVLFAHGFCEIARTFGNPMVPIGQIFF